MKDKPLQSKGVSTPYYELLKTEKGGGRGGVIRTRDPLLPKQMRYQAALRPDRQDQHPNGHLCVM